MIDSVARKVVDASRIMPSRFSSPASRITAEVGTKMSTIRMEVRVTRPMPSTSFCGKIWTFALLDSRLLWVYRAKDIQQKFDLYDNGDLSKCRTFPSILKSQTRPSVIIASIRPGRSSSFGDSTAINSPVCDRYDVSFLATHGV